MGSNSAGLGGWSRSREEQAFSTALLSSALFVLIQFDTSFFETNFSLFSFLTTHQTFNNVNHILGERFLLRCSQDFLQSMNVYVCSKLSPRDLGYKREEEVEEEARQRERGKERTNSFVFLFLLLLLRLPFPSSLTTFYEIESDGSKIRPYSLQTMNSTSAHNLTRELVRVILAMNDDERHPYKLQYMCHTVRCTFAMNDQDDQNSTCRVTGDSGAAEDGHQNQSSHLVSMAKYIHLYIYPLFIVLGILGNSLSCFIMLMNVRRAGGNPASLYLTLLAFVDCLFLLGSALPDWISQLDHRFNIRLLSDIACRSVYWFGHFTTHLSAGLVVGVTVERFIAVQYPLIAHKINTITRTRFALILLVIFFLVVDSPVLLLVKHINVSVHTVHACFNDTLATYERDDIIHCALSKERYEQTWVYVDFAVYTLIPFLIIVTLNSLIIRRLIDAQRFRQHMFRFHNYASSSRYDPSESKSRHYSDGRQAIELIEKTSRACHRFKSLPETKPLAVMLRPRFSE